jgi:hypothetical protein
MATLLGFAWLALFGIDGLSGKWKDGDVYGHFEGICHSIHNAIAQLSMNLDPQNYDLMNIGPVEDVVGEVCTMAMETGWGGGEDGTCIADSCNSMSLLFFGRQLDVHFSIMFLQNLI